MYLKRKLIKAAAICSYIFAGLWIVATACFFALSNYWYWLFLIFGLVSLYNGFVIASVGENMTAVTLEKREQIKLLVCWILSIVCPPAFILNGIAYFRNAEDRLVVVRQNAEAVKAEKPKVKKPFYKAGAFITMCVAFGMIIISSFTAMCFETSGFSVKVKDFTLTHDMTYQYRDYNVLESDRPENAENGAVNGKKYVMENDTKYSVTMYKPKTATEENPAATVFVLPGFTRTKATMSQYCIELSRRGAVVFCMDPGGQGSTTETSTAGANGIEYLVQYVYNNTDDYKFCDRTRFGAVGHSAGGGNVCTLAADMAGAGYSESVIKAVYISGYIKESSANKYKNLNCNAALSYAYYDEGAYRYQGDTSAYEIISLRFLNEVNGSDAVYDKVVTDYGYGSMQDGTYRIIHREKINHCFEMYDKTSIANTVRFFDAALQMNSGKGGDNQVWFGKEFCNGIALASAFTFVISLCAVLMRTPFFATLKGTKKRKPVAEAAPDAEGGQSAKTAAYTPVSTVADAKPVQPETAAAAHKTVAHKVIFWSCLLLTAIIACLDYIPLANLSIEIFPTSNLASVFTYTFPARMVNAILLWAAINGTIGLVIFFGTTLLENLYEYIMYKAKGVPPQYDWSKFKAITISGENRLGVFLNVLKALLLAFGAFGVFYFLVQLSYWTFHQDFRFMLISAAPLNARMFVTALEYMPIIFIFYISNSIRLNCSIGHEGWKEWKVMLVGAVANSIGLAFILLINYVCYFTTGAPYYGNWGDNNEVWLYVNMVFALVVMMFILPIFNRLFYRITGNVWTGAVACCMIFIMMTVSASVSYIPMY